MDVEDAAIPRLRRRLELHLHIQPPLGPDPDGDFPARGSTYEPVRLLASISVSRRSSVEPIATLYAETARAVLVAGHGRAGDDLVATQDHVLTVDALFRTLAVEATVHHLDLRLGQPSQVGLEETRRVLDGLLGRAAPIEDAVRYALIGTGREPPTENEADAFGADVERLPLFG